MEANVEEYLRSDEAAHDVAAVLAEKPTPSSCLPGTSFVLRGDWLLSLDEQCPWSALSHRGTDLQRGNIGVYFRQLQPGDVPEPEDVYARVNYQGWPEIPVGHYVVTDLGEGNRALKLRTGRMEGHQFSDDVNAAAMRTLGVPYEDRPEGGRVLWAWNGGDLYLPAVAPADLPRRLCQVLLASYRIARVEVRR